MFINKRGKRLAEYEFMFSELMRTYVLRLVQTYIVDLLSS